MPVIRLHLQCILIGQPVLPATCAKLQIPIGTSCDQSTSPQLQLCQPSLEGNVSCCSFGGGLMVTDGANFKAFNSIFSNNAVPVYGSIGGGIWLSACQAYVRHLSPLDPHAFPSICSLVASSAKISCNLPSCYLHPVATHAEPLPKNLMCNFSMMLPVIEAIGISSSNRTHDVDMQNL